ncbi:MAG: hypothetical protein QHJ73_10760 [Armatimonadota bacterium]|nr:hypothetical protein [Armatimonadota bacterium]
MRAIALLLVAVLVCLFSVMIFGAVKVTRMPRRSLRSRAHPTAAQRTPVSARPPAGAATEQMPAPAGPLEGRAGPSASSGAPPTARTTLPSRHPLVRALLVAAEPQLRREREWLERERVAAEKAESVGYRRWGKGSFRVHPEVLPTGAGDVPYTGTITLSWQRPCSPFVPTWQQASLAPLNQRAKGMVRLSYTYEQGAWRHQATERRTTIR